MSECEPDTSEHDKPSSKHEQPYSYCTVYWIRAVYILAIIIWVLLICYFRLYITPAAFVLWLPVIVFAIGLTQMDKVSVEVEKDMFKTSLLSVGLILALPLLGWMSRDYSGDRGHYVSIIILAMVISLLTLIDVWVEKKWLPVYKHYRSCLQTMALTLLIYAVITYYLCRPTQDGLPTH